MAHIKPRDGIDVGGGSGDPPVQARTSGARAIRDTEPAGDASAVLTLNTPDAVRVGASSALRLQVQRGPARAFQLLVKNGPIMAPRSG